MAYVDRGVSGCTVLYINERLLIRALPEAESRPDDEVDGVEDPVADLGGADGVRAPGRHGHRGGWAATEGRR